MQIELQDGTLRGRQLTQDQARLELAVGLFMDHRVTLGRGAEIARLPQAEFLRQLGRREIPVHYDVDDLRADLQTLRAVRPA